MSHPTTSVRCRIVPAGVLFLVALGLAACHLFPKGEVTNLRGESDMLLRNDKLDYAYKVLFTLTNRGAAGKLTVSPWLSCSEGRWTRSQELELANGETVNLEFSFHEPSISASNFQFGVKLEP